MFKNVLYCGLILCTISACEKQNLKRAEKSLDGTWSVVKIYSAYGQKLELGTQTTEEFTEDGNLGTFTFSEASVEYSYTRMDTLYEDRSNWQLIREKINAGFNKTEQYTLSFNNKAYICRFGDETKDAEKKATEVTLEYESDKTGAYTSIMFWLKKQ